MTQKNAWIKLKLQRLIVFSRSCFPDCTLTKFLNRILGLEVHHQNFLFQYFTENFDYLIEKDKKEGKYDMGILGEDFYFVRLKQFNGYCA